MTVAGSQTPVEGGPPEGVTTENAYFLRLDVENVTCFSANASVSFEASPGHPAQWTVLLGENGVGKTSLLQLLASGEVQNDSDRPAAGRLADAVVKLALHGTLPRRLRRIGSTQSKVEYVVGWGDSLTEPLFQNTNTVKLYDGGTSAMTFNVPKRSIVYGYGANRRRAPRGLTAESTDDTSATLFDDDATLRNPEEWFLQLDLVSKTESPSQVKAAQQLTRVADILKRILPNVQGVRVGSTNGGPIRAEMQVQTADGWVPFASMGLGYRTMTAWMCDFASRLFERYSELENPLAGAAVCLVDEIDLHLHPRWQRDLTGQLSTLFPNTQFIVTAHSPLIVQSARDARVYVLKRQGDSVSVESAPAEVRRWRLDQMLTSDLFGLPSARPADLDKLMQERDSLLGKTALSQTDESRLAELRAEIGDLSFGETVEDIEAMDIIRRAAKRLASQP
jgi:hypothetical protein